jgi:hypothetical protein
MELVQKSPPLLWRGLGGGRDVDSGDKNEARNALKLSKEPFDVKT